MPHVPSDKPCTFGSNWTGEREGFLLAFADIVWFILGWNFWDWECITLTNSGCYRKCRIIWAILHIWNRPEYWQLPGTGVLGHLCCYTYDFMSCICRIYSLIFMHLLFNNYVSSSGICVGCHQHTILYFPSSVPSRTRWCLGAARIDWQKQSMPEQSAGLLRMK